VLVLVTCFFFFQAEVGIRYFHVTGVQTCALPISVFPVLMANKQWVMKYRTWKDGTYYASGWSSGMDNQRRMQRGYSPQFDHGHRSEERRVGKGSRVWRLPMSR